MSAFKLLASDQGGGEDFPLPPTGTHLAYCYALAELGHQSNTFEGKTSVRHRAMFFFELPTELHTFKEGEKPEPFAVSKEYTISLHKKANLRADLESWRGKSFTDEELAGFDISRVVGAPCLITIVHEKGKKDASKTYAVISAISAIPKAMKAAGLTPMFNEQVFYSLEMGDCAAFHKLPEWVRKKVAESHERTGKMGKAGGGTGPSDPDLAEGDIPF